MAKELLELLAALAVLILTVAGTVKLANRQTEKSMEAERSARADLEKQLRLELDQAVRSEQVLRKRVVDLEAEHLRDQDKLSRADDGICDLRGQLATVLNEMAALQKRTADLEIKLEKEQAENIRLRAENDDLRGQLGAARRDLEQRVLEVRVYQNALALVGGKLTGNEPGESHAPEPEATEVINEEKQA